MRTWNGILRIIEIKHLDANGDVLWHDHNVYNYLHQDGEEFLLRAAFTGGKVSTIIPDNYYLGLDNRMAVAENDTLDDLVGEPTSWGYERQAVNSSGDFSLNLESDHYVATSPIVGFRALGGSWGPVSNLFLSSSADNSGFLISTAVLTAGIFLTSGQSITMRIGMQLKACS